MKVPTALFSGGQDTLADPKDIAVLLTQVSSVPPGRRSRVTILTLILLPSSSLLVHLYVCRCLTWSSISILNTGSMWTLFGVWMPQMWCFPTYWSYWKSTARGRWATFCRRVCISNTSTVHRFGGEVSSQGFDDFIPKRNKLVMCLIGNFLYFFKVPSEPLWVTDSLCVSNDSISVTWTFQNLTLCFLFCYSGEVSILSTPFIGTAKCELC